VQKETWTLTNGTKYTLFPMCLACAITVNKAQGCTFEQINIDRGNGFWMPGQLYVALSRCKTREGIHILKPLKEKDVHVDVDALEMMQQDKSKDEPYWFGDIEF
jgi:ATP-dependent exoDNAse (exonuclease V) alpha subunit